METHRARSGDQDHPARLQPVSARAAVFDFRASWWSRLIAAARILLVSLSLLNGLRADDASTQESARQNRFWAYRPLTRPTPPATREPAASDLDRFVLAKLEAHGLTFAPEADSRTLCRRLYLDLIGLPPDPDELDAFVNDTSPQALENLVTRLLASPHYGERWGRQWLDVVGYADSNGYIRHDSPRPLAYHYRDYVIQSLNSDKPYDQFWREQLAGDELVNVALDPLTRDDMQTLIATHYLRNVPDGTDNTEGNETTRVIERYAVLDALLQTTMSAMFGMTIDCARCHDHKFDPIPQRDYYALQAIFYPAFNVKEWVQPKNRWIHAAGQAEIAAWRASTEQADREVAALRTAHQAWISAHRPPGVVRWKDDFSGEALSSGWSPTAPAEKLPEATPRAKLDADGAPAARLDAGRLSLLAAPAGDSRWVVTRQAFDWTPQEIGESIQVTFDLVDSRGADGQAAERVGYYIALHDYDDDSAVAGGNLLFDGNPAGGASVVLDYPGTDQKGLGTIGETGYLPGTNFGVRITRVAEKELLLQHLVNGRPESKSLSLTAEQLPDGGFGFELCCSRSFIVDNVIVESSPEGSQDNALAREWAAFSRQLNERNRELSAAIDARNAKRVPEPHKIPWVTDLSARPPVVHQLHRGDYFQPGDVVSPGPPTALNDAEDAMPIDRPMPGSKTTGRRLQFAGWATRPGSRAAALLARVHVDRLWRGHFGQGLVPTPENFGVSGVGPTHPELLEWLASELIAGGWRQKSVQRTIVLSRAYRQTSAATPLALKVDPQNTHYSRFPSHRLEAEQIRDSMLAVAGILNSKMGGQAVDFVDQGNRQIVLASPVGSGPNEVDRRSIYIRSRRSQPLTFLQMFDQARPEPNCLARGASTVVAQSLAMLNSEFALRMSREFARRILQENGGQDESAHVRGAFQIALGRDPSEPELARCLEFLRAPSEQRSSLSPDLARREAFADFCRMLLATNEYLFLP